MRQRVGGSTHRCISRDSTGVDAEDTIATQAAKRQTTRNPPAAGHAHMGTTATRTTRQMRMLCRLGELDARSYVVGDRLGITDDEDRHVLSLHGVRSGVQRVTARRRVLCVGVVLAAGSTAGCMSHSSWISSGAPPTVICGQTISNTAAGAVVTDATRGSAVTVTAQTAGGVVLRLSDSCAYGATITVTPSAAMRITAEARARDDRLAAAVLRPIAAIADVVVAHPDGTSTIVHIRLNP